MMACLSALFGFGHDVAALAEMGSLVLPVSLSTIASARMFVAVISAIRVWRCSKRIRACAASAAVQSLVGSTVTIAIQSTGQGATQRSQPVQSDAITVCINLFAPMIASTGQACMHRVHPMQNCSSMTATCKGKCSPQEASSARAGKSSNSASLAMPSSPPGGQRLMAALPLAIACA